MAGPMTPGRRKLLAFGVPFSLLVIGYGALSLVNVIGLTSYDASRTVTVVGGAKALTVNADEGYVHLQLSADANVHVRQKGHYTWSKPKVTVVSVASGVTIKGHCANLAASICTQDLIVEVPADFRVTARSSGGDVTAKDLSGALNLSSSSGDVRATNAVGPLVLESSAGDVKASGLLSTDVSASSSAGDVRLAFVQPPSRVEAGSSAGDVAVTLPNTVAYQVTAHSSAGDTHVGVHTDSTATRTVNAHSSAGDVSVQPG